MGVECAALKTWFKSIQSKIGKITDTKSGSATKTLTDRDKYMDHIVRQPSRVALSLKSRLQPPPPTTSSVAEPLHTDSDDDTAQPARRGSQPTDTVGWEPPNQQQRPAVCPPVRPRRMKAYPKPAADVDEYC